MSPEDLKDLKKALKVTLDQLRGVDPEFVAAVERETEKAVGPSPHPSEAQE